MPREDGLLSVMSHDADKPVAEIPTIQCVHCGGHWVAQPGSGRIRGFCQNCMGPVCGPGCAECIPTDLYLTNLEKGRPDNFRPICVPTS